MNIKIIAEVMLKTVKSMNSNITIISRRRQSKIKIGNPKIQVILLIRKMKIGTEEDFENEVLAVKINEVDPKVVIQIDQFHQDNPHLDHSQAKVADNVSKGSYQDTMSEM